MNTNYKLRLATLDEAYVIWQIMDTCFQALEHKDYFFFDDLDYVKDILSGHGFGIVACDADNHIIGNLLVKYPGVTRQMPSGNIRSKGMLSCADFFLLS